MIKGRAKQAELYDNNIKVSLFLAKFIKRNKSLMHLDLTSTQMTEIMLWTVGKALSRAPSLQGIHLSGNPGITAELRA
jgi:hypothetical protein